MQLATADYGVTFVILLIPLAIGIFYAWKDSKSVNREEYLLGGRKMSMLPVSLSIFVTYQSAISLIGVPSEIYQYGPMIFGLYVGIGVSWIFGCYMMVPLMYPLQLTSLFEYLEMRFESRAVRMLSTIVGMLQAFFYMVVAMLAPGLAVQAAAGIPFWMSVVIVGSIGTLYTAIGGIKSVIWTDAFQTIIMFIGIAILIVRGTMVVGGVKQVWDVAEEGGRTFLGEISPDPRTRHSWWGLVIGGTFIWFTNIFNQSTMQRMTSMKTIASAQTSFLLNLPSNILYGLLLTVVGIIIYSYFYVVRCDPIKAGLISNPNQLIPFFLLHALQDTPGLAGLYMATIFSGALSTLSSGINALACNTVEDVLRNPLRAFSEKSITILAKILVFVYGFAIVGVTYLAKSMEGSVTQMGVSVFGACGSANLGMFVMGCTVPWANKYGAFVGGFMTLVFNIWLVTGSRLHGKKIPTLPPVSIDQCSQIVNRTFDTATVVPTLNFTSYYNTLAFTTSTTVTDVASESGFFLYDISYIWSSFIGFIVCCLITAIVSKVTSSLVKSETDAQLIFPFLRKFWKLNVLPTKDVKELESLKLTETI